MEIKELSLTELRPVKPDDEMGGMKLIVLGKPQRGKSVLIKSIIAAKRHIIPAAVVISGSEEANHFYSKLLPNCFVYNKFDADIITRVKQRQLALKNVDPEHSWLMLIFDDCMDNAKMFNHEAVMDLFKNGRHWNVLVIIASQYIMDLNASLRCCIDGIFLFTETSQTCVDKIYKQFGGNIPKQTFHTLMEKVTQDHTCLYIDNTTTRQKWEDMVRYYKAPLLTDADVGFGFKDYKAGVA
uniref:Adenosine triphosphatase n=3 Tax=Iridoviridae TaxID=10486 RepID=G3EMH9_ISKNV|nr:adenosine triphosphatase [Giant seaperch iridovirus]ADX41582.1 adenosine triphosphatase [King grouper iridovirus]ADX41583.1 adenosine triphosphatase [Marble goby iridovirus]ADX41586.1 adenosine triphosphatase [King grouper iridovirus]ADX41590.1 adenosine triphosphatase [King grouper iridovirus]